MNRAFKVVVSFILLASIFFSCSKELSYETSMIPVVTTGSGTLKDTLGDCLPITVQGTYFNGVAIGGDTNYVQITVNVKTTGSYNIQTPLQNGFQFAGAGVFNSTGIQTINLKASGTPSQITPTNFTVTFDSAACPFTVNVQDSTGHSGSNGGGTDTSIAVNKWQFVANGHTYTGNISSASFTNLIGANLVIIGTMASGGTDTAFGITVEFTGTTLDTGTFMTSSAGTNFALTKVASGDIIFAANATSSNEVINITISSYIVSSKTVSGTFSGISYDFNGNDVPITNGKFKATVQ